MKNRFYAKKSLVVVLALMALCLAATPSKAMPIVYNFYGFAWGDLDGVEFNNLPAVFSIPGNTVNVSEVIPGSGLWANDNLTGTANIPGVVQGDFTDLLYVFCYNGDQTNPPQVGFGDSTLGLDLAILAPQNSDSLKTYDLQSFFGPTQRTPAFVSQFGGIDIGGALLTIDFFDASFRAAATAVPPSAIPLPAGFLLLGSGLIRLIGYRRFHRS